MCAIDVRHRDRSAGEYSGLQGWTQVRQADGLRQRAIALESWNNDPAGVSPSAGNR
jgi:hypothetical protein